jgi:hypothetical protein
MDNFRTIKESFVRNKETVARCLAEMNNLGRGGADLASRSQWSFISNIIEDKIGGH